MLWLRKRFSIPEGIGGWDRGLLGESNGAGKERLAALGWTAEAAVPT
jgi:hypothetical protein